MAKIIIDQTGKDEANKTLLNPYVHDGPFFNEFVKSKKNKEKGITDEDAFNLREKTYDILSHCNPHNGVNNPDTTHLVVGYVQSGKTMSFTALTALAHDNNYRIIIYLAGTKINLLEQTISRLKKDLYREGSDAYWIIRISNDDNSNSKRQIIGALRSQDSPIILMPVLKHFKYINVLAELFKDQDIVKAIRNETTIIIDDEADQASLNSYTRQNALKEGTRKSSTYDAILNLRSQLAGNSYIQYTATPQANLLMSMDDLLSPKSHTLLYPGEGYIGGKLFFGRNTDEKLFNGCLIMTIPPKDVYDKKRNRLKSIPKSLTDALMLHILAVAIVVEWEKTSDINFLSMMVHTDNTRDVNSLFKKWIDEELDDWCYLLSRPEGHNDREALYNKFKKLFNDESVRFYDEYERPNFDNIKPYIEKIIYKSKTYLVTSDVRDPEIDWTSTNSHILVGAEMLNRGFTVEHLATTYMSRHSAGIDNADTIEQRCRFFGYKRSYIKSCRVFLPESIILKYRQYVEHEEELRQVLSRSPNLGSFERTIMLTKKLRPTRLNVIHPDVVRTTLNGMHSMYAFDSEPIIKCNIHVVEEFLKKHENDEEEIIKYTDDATPDRTHRKIKIPVDEIIELLSNFKFGSSNDFIRKAITIRYLKYLSSDERKVRLPYVYFIQMAYKGDARDRAFNMEEKRLVNANFFSGPSPKGADIYPGDSKIIGGDETLTFQLHHIRLKEAFVDYPQEAYTLAVYYPEQLANTYVINTGNGKDNKKYLFDNNING